MHDSRSATPPPSAQPDERPADGSGVVRDTSFAGESIDGSASGDPVTFEVPDQPEPSWAPPTATRPGQLTPQWRMMLGLAWAGAIFAYAAVWQASVQLGIGLWWVGPRSLPTPIWVKMIPFLAPTALLIAIGFNVRRLPTWGLLGSAVAALVAIPDFSRSTGLALTELAIAAAVALVSAMSFTGLYRIAPDAGDSVERS